MIEKIDKRIAALESELAELKQKKIAILQAQLAEVQASLSGGASPPRARRGRPAKNVGWAAALPAEKKTRGPRRRGRRPGKRVPDEQVLAAITKVVSAAGKEGISARKVAATTGVHYPRVVKLMDKSFRKTGERKWSRYHAK